MRQLDLQVGSQQHGCAGSDLRSAGGALPGWQPGQRVHLHAGLRDTERFPGGDQFSMRTGPLVGRSIVRLPRGRQSAYQFRLRL